MSKLRIKRHGYFGIIVMIVGLFGDNFLSAPHLLFELVFLGLAVAGFALAYDGIEKTKK